MNRTCMAMIGENGKYAGVVAAAKAIPTIPDDVKSPGDTDIVVQMFTKT